MSELRGTTVPFNGMQLAVSKNMIESLKVLTGHSPLPHHRVDGSLRASNSGYEAIARLISAL